MKQLLPQQCPMAFLYMTWLLYVGGLVYLPVRGNYAMAAVWAVAVPLGLWGYVRLFPRISHLLGYGRVDDVGAAVVDRSPVQVTMYGSLGCPFCPIVKRRLDALREEMGFELSYVDVTLRPDVLKSQGIKSVPVVDVAGRRLIGNATSEELAELVGGRKTA